MGNAQPTVENAAKAVLALLGPVGRTHNLAVPLRETLKRGAFSFSQSEDVRQIAEYAEMLGPDIHMQTDYSDEAGGLTPWNCSMKPTPEKPWQWRKRR